MKPPPVNADGKCPLCRDPTNTCICGDCGLKLTERWDVQKEEHRVLPDPSIMLTELQVRTYRAILDGVLVETALAASPPSEDGEPPNQHAVVGALPALEVRTCRSVAVAIDDLVSVMAEAKSLREQVDMLQAQGTAQLQAARAAAFEMCALECERVAQEGWDAMNGTAAGAAANCAAAIRALAKR